jgi:hypothetical protein
MMAYARLNKQKEIKCREEGIDRSQASLFCDTGDTSPLFRCGVISICLAKKAHSIVGIPYSMIPKLYPSPTEFRVFQCGSMMKNEVYIVKTENYLNKIYDLN